MGSGSWNSGSWSTYSSSTASMPTAAIYKSHMMKDALDPLKIKIREARDSITHPESTPIIIGLDVSGSMGILADNMAKKGLGVVVEELLARKPIKDPQIMFMAISDPATDRTAIQVTQFESDNTIIPQLEDLWLEHNGGGNGTEGYQMPWFFAATKVAADAWEKRKKKGYLFTIGDEGSPMDIQPHWIKKFIDEHSEITSSLPVKDVLKMAQERFNVFHIVVEQGSYCSSAKDQVYTSWRNLMGERVLPLVDVNDLAEVIVSTIQVVEGTNINTVINSWSGSTAVTVRKAVEGLVHVKTAVAGGKGIVKLS